MAGEVNKISAQTIDNTEPGVCVCVCRGDWRSGIGCKGKNPGGKREFVQVTGLCDENYVIKIL